jgi:hypothetical protein
MTLTAALDETVNLQTAREDDRITLTVRNAPRPELEGARIYGTIYMANGARDNARLTLQFDEIRLANGRNSAFDGVIERVVAPNGRAVRFDGEVTSVDRNGPDAVTRGAIGAGIGALIGALPAGARARSSARRLAAAEPQPRCSSMIRASRNFCEGRSSRFDRARDSH